MKHVPWAKRRLGTFRHNLADSAIAPPNLAAMGLPASTVYAPESRELPDTLGELLGARIGAPGARVLVTAGASEAIAVVFSALLEPGDEVLVEAPGYEPHRLVPSVFGLRVRTFSHPVDGAPGAIAAAVESALAPSTRLVALTDLQNPSGVRLTDEDTVRLDALAEAHDLRLFVDETFRDASRRAPATLASRGSRWVTSGSLTKSFGLGGLRIGWVSGSPAVLDNSGETHNALSAQPSRPSLALARDLMPHLATLIERTHAILDTNQARWATSIERGRGVFTASPSEGTVTWCRFGAEGAGDAFAALADRQFGIGVVPGSFFGDAAGVRVSLGCEPRAFAEAADAWDRAVIAFAAAAATRESA